MSSQYERILKLRRWRQLQKALQANQLLEQVKAAEGAVSAMPDEKTTIEQIDSAAPANSNAYPVDEKD